METTSNHVEMSALPRRAEDGSSIAESLKSSASKGTSSTIGALVNGVSGGVVACAGGSVGGASGGGASSSREKSKSKERVGAGLSTPEKSASKSPLIGKKAQQKEEKDALRRIEAQKELNRDLAMAIMIAALTPPRHRKQRTSAVALDAATGGAKVSLVPSDDAVNLDVTQLSGISSGAVLPDTPETRRKSTTTLNMTAASLNYSVSTSVGATPETSRKTGYGSYEVLNSLPRDVLFPPEDPTPPASNVAWAALACVLCPWMACCGVTAIKAGRESQRQTAAGNLKDARHHAERAKLCAGITFFVGAAILLISVEFFLTH